MRIVLTGSQGFIGQHTAKKLHELGHEVIGIDDFSRSERTSNFPYLKAFYEGDCFYLDNILEKEPNIDLIIHLAADLNSESHESSLWKNTLKLARMLDAMERRGIPKIICASSAGVYGETIGDVSIEEDELLPVTMYGASKAAMEMFLSASRLKTAVLRFSNVYGPGQNTAGGLGIVTIIKERLEKNLPIEIYNGTQTRDFIHVSDVVEGIIQAIDLEGTYNVSTGVETSINEVLSLLQKHIPSRLFVER